MQQFNIRDYVEFNQRGRATCPCCEALKGKSNTNLSLVPETDGAYKCFRGCRTEDIRSALGVPRNHQIPAALATVTPPAAKTTVSPQKVREAHETLMQSKGAAKAWLHSRGITDGLIQRHQLGITRAKTGDKFLPSITIPIPNADGTAFWQKKRVAPWLKEAELKSQLGESYKEYKAWSQYGIPARTWFSWKPAEATVTILCEGEWDAILLGQMMREGNQAIAVASFTCGCGSVPKDSTQLEVLPGTIYICYDRDEPGEKGSQIAAKALGERARVMTCPRPISATEDDQWDTTGWDVSDAINHGSSLSDFIEAMQGAIALATTEPKQLDDNPLRARLITNDELMATAPDYVEWLVPDLLPANELIMLAAGPRAGKSLLAMLLAKAVAAGESFLDRPVTQGAVLYVRCEDAPVKIKQRQTAQGLGKGLPVHWLDRFKLSQTAYLKELAEELDVRLIVLDTLSRIRDDGTTESSAEMTRVIEPLQEMAEDLNCSIVLVHHTGKVKIENADKIDVFDTIRGSSSIRNTCRGSMVLAADSDCYRLCAENGYGKIDLKVRLDGLTLEWKLLGRWTEAISSDQRSTVEDYLNKVGQATLDQISDDTQIPKPSLYKVLSRLARENFIVKSGNRRQVLYTRSSDFIRLSDDLSDDVSLAGTGVQAHLTKNTSSFYEAQSDQLPQSDHPTCAKDDHFAENDHFQGVGEKTQNCQVKPANVDTVREISSDKSSENPVLSDEADESGESDHRSPLRAGDRVKYVGGVRSLVRICGIKHLEILDANDESATVKHDAWLVTQTVSLADLRRV